MDTLSIQKNLSQNGFLTAPTLEYIVTVLGRARQHLVFLGGQKELAVASYLEQAMEDLEMTRYLETVDTDVD